MSKSGTAAAIPVGCKFLLGLAAAQILTGTGVDLDALTLLDKDRNLNTVSYTHLLQVRSSGTAHFPV